MADSRPVVGLAPKGAQTGRVVVGLAPKTSSSGRTVVGLPGEQPQKKAGGGGSSLLGRFGSDLKNAALNSVGGIVKLGEDVALDFKDLVPNAGRGIAQAAHPGAAVDSQAAAPLSRTSRDLGGIVTGTAETLKHPSRHPGDFLLTVLPGISGLARVGEGLSAASRVAKAGEGAAAVVKAAVKPEIGPRVLDVNGMEVRGHYSRAAGSRAVQKLTDKALQAGAEQPNRLGVHAENLLHRRAAKWETRNQRVADATARAAGTRLAAAGAKLKPEELRALRLVAEETPVGRRLGAQEMRMGRAKNAAEAARHQERIDVTKKAQAFLDEHPQTGAPVFKPGATKLAHVYGLLKTASSDREGILKNLDLMDEQSLQASKTKAARVAAGAVMETQKEATSARGIRPTRARVEQFREYAGRSKTVIRDMTDVEAKQRLSSLDKQYESMLAKVAPEVNPYSAEDVAAETKARNTMRGRMAKGKKPATGRAVEGRVGGGSARIPTVNQEVRDLAEAKLLHVAEKNKGTATADRVLALIDERNRLREALNSRVEHGLGIAEEAPTSLPSVTETIPGKPRRVHLREQQASKGVQAARQLTGAEDITASPDAVFIGNPVERARLSGKPKVSSTGTLGHTRKPSSLKTSTGSSVEHALERGDVTRIVAERHAEAVRLAKIDRVVQKFKQAGEKTPRRKDDVWVWTDKLVSNERIPKEVRSYLDNPEGLAKLPPDEQQSLFDKVKQATFEQHDWRDPEKTGEFEQLAKKGQGVFVPRRLLGEFASRDYTIGHLPGVKFLDAVNNAQKAGLVYLKLNYPLVQGVSNTAMGIIHQGFAYPINVTKAVRLSQRIGADYTAVVDDIMGQGAVMQAAFEGQGAISKASQTLAHVMSDKVDTPARRAAFLHEAAKAGYGTPERLIKLLTDDKAAGDLAEVAQRAKEAIVDYGDLGPAEKSIVRRLLFVYPWQKGATKYAGHFLRDHPVQAAAAAQLGEFGKQQSDNVFGALPSYLEGLIPVGGRAVNPSGVNFFQTPAQIGEAVAGLATGNPAQRSAGQGFLSPAPGIIAGLVGGHDDIGRPLSGNILAKLRDLTYGQTPAASLARAAAGEYAPVRKVFGSRRNSQTFPEISDAYWRFLLGGLYPRRYDQGALNQNAARDKTGR